MNTNNKTVQWCHVIEAELEVDLTRHTLRMADYIIRKEQESNEKNDFRS